MYRHDPQTFEKVIEPILENYPNKEMNEKGKEVPCNPFLKYKEEHGDYIRKYSKKAMVLKSRVLNTMIVS